MPTYVLHLHRSGRQDSNRMEVTGDTIAIAIISSNLLPGEYALITAYEDSGQTIEVASKSNCGCVYHAEEGIACSHDLERIGIYTIKHRHYTGAQLDFIKGQLEADGIPCTDENIDRWHEDGGEDFRGFDLDDEAGRDLDAEAFPELTAEQYEAYEEYWDGQR